MRRLSFPHVSTTNITVKSDVSVTEWVCLKRVSGRDIFEAIGQNVGVVIAPYEWAILGHGNETCKIRYFTFRIAATLFERAEIEQLGTGVDIRPKAVLQDLLRAPQLLVDFERVEVGEHTHNFGEAVDLQNVEKLKSLHLKAESSIDEQEHEIGNCRGVELS